MVWYKSLGRVCWLLGCTVLALGIAAPGLAAPQADFERGYFLQTHENDCAGAVAAFEKVVQAADAPEPLRAEAAVRLAQCREDLAASDFARLMPPQTIAYFEITRPGDHVTQLLKLLGLVREPGAKPAEPGAKGMPLPVPGLFFPEDFTISPALTSELKKLKGLAVAITEVGIGGPPSAVAVLHPGDFNLLRGELETAVQLVQPDEPIEGYKTYQVHGMAWITVTPRLFVAGSSREQVAAAVARLKNQGAESLASQEEFRRARSAGGDTAMLAYLSGPQLLKQFGSHIPPREGAIARNVLDIDHLQSLVFTAGTTPKGLRIEGSVNLAPGHRSLIYGLIQTAPLSKQSLQYVPGGVAGVVLLGLNPAAPAGATPASAGPNASRVSSLMDLGREMFGNVEEIALFALPPAPPAPGKDAAPEAGMVMAVKDAAKSETLWQQWLGLGMLAAGRGTGTTREVTIEGRPGKVYAIHMGPSIAVVRLSDRALAVGTEGAVTAAVKAGVSKHGIQNDPAMKPLVDQLSPTASKAVLVDVGRIVQAIAAAHPRHSGEMAMAALAAKDLKVSAVSDEAPDRFAVRMEVTGLPHLPGMLKAAIAPAPAEVRTHAAAGAVHVVLPGKTPAKSR